MLKTKDEIPSTSGVYKIENKTNHKVYIGSAVNLYHRMYLHNYTLENHIHKNKHLQASWDKYGEENFEFSVIEECDKDNLLTREQYWLDYYKAYDNQYGYNICIFAGNTLGKKLSEETKQKISKAHIGKKASDEARRKMSKSRTGENNGMYGKHHTEESKQKMREHAPDYNGEKNPFYGRKHSDETKNILREKAIKRNLCPNAKLSEKEVFEIKWELFRKPENMQWQTLYELLANKYNVTFKTILNIKREYRWRNLKVYTYTDRKNRFVEMFNPKNGFYVRSGVFDKNGKDTGIDPFMRQFPSLIDVGIMQKCVCSKYCNVDCYQKACDRTGDNMSLENYISILEQCKGKVFQLALGGAGDVDTHENFEDIMRITREYNIVPNFTTSGISMTKEKAEICKKYAGAVAISMHFADYTYKAIQMLLDAGVETNIHYVLSNKSIDTAIDWLKNDKFPKGIHAVVWLLYKPIGLGKMKNVLKTDDPRLKEFFDLIDNKTYEFSHGFDACSIPGIINFTKNIDSASIDTCEAARFSAYITPDMKMLPCSFDNQDLKWAVDLNTHTIQEAWNSDVFEDFRNHFRCSCNSCKDKEICRGGCPICRDIVLCNRKEKDLQ